jgi:hypothetical protein
MEKKAAEKHDRGGGQTSMMIVQKSGMGPVTTYLHGDAHIELQVGKFGSTLAHAFYNDPIVVFERFRVKTFASWGLGHVDHRVRSRIENYNWNNLLFERDQEVSVQWNGDWHFAKIYQFREDLQQYAVRFGNGTFDYIAEEDIKALDACVEKPVCETVSNLGVKYYSNFLNSGLRQKVSDFIISSEQFKRTFFARALAGKYSERDNVKKFVLTLFREAEDPNSAVITSGTCGYRNIYDWSQTAECYGDGNVMNIHDFPVALELLNEFNSRFSAELDGKLFNSLYIIYYREGRTSSTAKGDYINAHQDKTKTFEKNAPFALYNHLSDGSPRRFAFLEKEREIETYPMEDNDCMIVTGIANDTVKHALKEERDWHGFRASIVARCISDVMVAGPAETLSVNYRESLTPPDVQRSPISYSIRDGRKKPFVHAKELIEQRESKNYFFKMAKQYSESGDSENLERLIASDDGQYVLQENGEYSHNYRRAVCKFHAARNMQEMQEAFEWVESVGISKKIGKPTWDAYKKTQTKKAKKRWSNRT